MPMMLSPKGQVAPWDRPATDWSVRGLITLDKSISLLTGSFLVFTFESLTAQVKCAFAFGGAGVGLQPAVFPYLPFDFALPANGVRIHIGHVFAAANLDAAAGWIVDVGVNDPLIRLSKDSLRITAFDFSFKPYFAFQQVPGPDVMPSIGASWVMGHWRLVGLFDKATGNLWNNAKLNAQRKKPIR
jgi:hypothetical protein